MDPNHKYISIQSKIYGKKPWKFQYLAFVLITNNLSYVAFHHGTSFTIQTLSSSIRSKLQRLSYIGQSLQYLKNLEVVNEKVVLTEIVKLMGVGYTGEVYITWSNSLVCHKQLTIA